MNRVEVSGDYTNIFTDDGELRVSVSEKKNEVLVYENGVEEPVVHRRFDTGEHK